MRCAGRRVRPCGAADGLAPPAPAARDTRRQDCDGSTLPQAPIGSLPIRSDGLPCQSPTDDDRQVSSEDRRSVKLRVRPPPAGTHQCHRATSAGSGMMLTVKFSGSVADVADEERPPELPWISISPEIMSHAVWVYHRFGVRFRDAADLLAQHGLTVSDDAIRLWCLDFDSADAPPAHASTGPAGRHLAPRQGLRQVCSVDATLVDRPPRGWARASREPAMLGTNNGRRPQLDTTVRSHQRGIGRHRPTDAVAAWPKTRRRAGRILPAATASRRHAAACGGRRGWWTSRRRGAPPATDRGLRRGSFWPSRPTAAGG